MSAAQSDNGTHHRAGSVDLQAEKPACKPGSGACDGYPYSSQRAMTPTVHANWVPSSVKHFTDFAKHGTVIASEVAIAIRTHAVVKMPMCV
ncbi:hypothetical protein LF1_54430 [Rubripirellula obstinata]|uniref:Uncharacterized protein n=1 Tax=Rubripirellula obstinata TaxID=406547 RepID=A0A5B1CD74_9BACT|nr:hypothetical protein LF1_54430 [Rubripirellula obstinata]